MSELEIWESVNDGDPEKLSDELVVQWDNEPPDAVDWGWLTGVQLNILRKLESKLEAMERLRNAVSRDGTLVPYHLRTWADRISETNGYSGANIEVWLRDVAAALAAAQQEKE